MKTVLHLLFAVWAVTFVALGIVHAQTPIHTPFIPTAHEIDNGHSSLAAEHPDDVVNTLIYIATGLGSLLLLLVTYTVLSQNNRTDRNLAEIKAAIASDKAEIKNLIEEIDRHFTHAIRGLELRVHANELEVEALKTGCSIYHGKDRRKIDLLKPQDIDND